MPCKRVTAKLKRKQGMFHWVIACPYCEKNHWVIAGPYIEDPSKRLGVIKTRCGHSIEIVNEVKQNGSGK